MHLKWVEADHKSRLENPNFRFSQSFKSLILQHLNFRAKNEFTYLCPKVWVVMAGCIAQVPGKVKKIHQTQMAQTTLVIAAVSGGSQTHAEPVAIAVVFRIELIVVVTHSQTSRSLTPTKLVKQNVATVKKLYFISLTTRWRL